MTRNYIYSTGDSHEEPVKSLFRERRLRLTSNNSVKNTIITAVSCLVESSTILLTKVFFAASKLRDRHFLAVHSSQPLYTKTRCKHQKYSQSHSSADPNKKIGPLGSL